MPSDIFSPPMAPSFPLPYPASRSIEVSFFPSPKLFAMSMVTPSCPFLFFFLPFPLVFLVSRFAPFFFVPLLNCPLFLRICCRHSMVFFLRGVFFRHVPAIVLLLFAAFPISPAALFPLLITPPFRSYCFLGVGAVPTLGGLGPRFFNVLFISSYSLIRLSHSPSFFHSYAPFRRRIFRPILSSLSPFSFTPPRQRQSHPPPRTIFVEPPKFYLPVSNFCCCLFNPGFFGGF